MEELKKLDKNPSSHTSNDQFHMKNTQIIL